MDHSFPEMKKYLGFGCMRLPMKGDEVDLEQFIQMTDLFLENGFNYFDTAHGYIDGKSETAIRAALTSRHKRDEYLLTDKLTDPYFQKEEDIRPFFEKQLAWCGVDYFDFYLMHAQSAGNYEKFRRCHAYETAFALKKEGKIRHVGISFHDKVDVLDQILTDYPEIEIVQIQFNYLDYEDASVEGRKVYEVARKHNKPLLIMEPVKGGSLANLPAPVAEILHEADPARSQAAWALRFAASLPGLVTVLSGMSDLAQMRDNLATMKDAAPLTADENAVICAAQTKLAAIPSVPCTDCRYCVKDCPAGVAIPGVFKSLNTYLVYGNLAGAKGSYGYNCRTGEKAAACLACGQCESVCPQHINIIERLREAAELLGG